MDFKRQNNSIKNLQKIANVLSLIEKNVLFAGTKHFKKLSKEFELRVGVNENILEIIKTNIINCQKLSDTVFVTMFDEMAIKKNLNYNIKDDVIDGYQDHGSFHGRVSQEAIHALVFMIAGLRKKIK